MNKTIIAIAFSLASGCTSRGIATNDAALVGTWATSAPSGACASYTFRSDGSMLFNGEQGALNGGYFADDARLSLGFDGQPTAIVPYVIAQVSTSDPAIPYLTTLTISDDPATSPPRDVVYGRHLCAP